MNKRTILLNFRVTADERNIINNLVKKTGLSREQFIRDSVMNKKIHECPSADYNRFIFELRRVGQNLNRLLAIAYSNGLLDVPSIRNCLNEIRTLDREIHYEFWGKNDDEK